MGRDGIEVLVVDRLESAAETVHHLEAMSTPMRLSIASDVEEATEAVDDGGVDCVVSNFEIPRPDGVEFVGAFDLLDAVRESDPDVPFVLFTDVGNETIAEMAVTRGVTEYVPRTASNRSYGRLVDRVERAVSYRRVEQRAQRQARINEVIRDVNQSLVRADDREEIAETVCAELAGDRGYAFAWWGVAAPTGRFETAALVAEGDADAETAAAIAAESDPVCDTHDARTLFVSTDATHERWRPLAGERITALVVVPVGYDGTGYGVVVLGSTASDGVDETERAVVAELGDTVGYAINATEARTELRRQNDRLDTFAAILSHDLRNPLGVAQAYLGELDGDANSLAAVDESLERMEELVDDVLQLAREGADAYETRIVDVGSVAGRAWSRVETDDASLSLDPTLDPILADESRLSQLFENLFRNSVEHGLLEANDDSTEPSVDGDSGVAVPNGGTAVGLTVTIESTAEGFAVADDGTGLPEGTEDRIFESGYSDAGGTGLGLAIVTQVAESHGWTVDAGESDAGGARFVFGDVRTP